MDLEEAQEIAREVIAQKSRSYVSAAQRLAEYVDSLVIAVQHKKGCLKLPQCGCDDRE